jgi:hypothetical protein
LSLKGCSRVMARQLNRSPTCRQHRHARGAKGATRKSGGRRISWLA